MKPHAKRLQDINGISSEMVDKLIAVVAEGLATGNEDLRQLLYCAYREARNIERGYIEVSAIRYRPLVKGELVEHGDEILNDSAGWINTISGVGTYAPAPEFTNHPQYRRRLRGIFDVPVKSNPINTETIK